MKESMNERHCFQPGGLGASLCGQSMNLLRVVNEV
jgi:hypothetical protein